METTKNSSARSSTREVKKAKISASGESKELETLKKQVEALASKCSQLEKKCEALENNSSNTSSFNSSDGELSEKRWTALRLYLAKTHGKKGLIASGVWNL